MRWRHGDSRQFLTAYAHPEVLLDAAWLADHVDDPKVRIVDAHMPTERALYDGAHIPSSVFIDMLRDLRGPSRIMPPERFATLMGRLRIGNDTTVVAYDTEGGSWAARPWWALRYYGHAATTMLDGGLRAWASTRP